GRFDHEPSELLTELNVPLMLVPRFFTIVTQATTIRTSMTAYSTAVGPPSLTRKRRTFETKPLMGDSFATNGRSRVEGFAWWACLSSDWDRWVTQSKPVVPSDPRPPRQPHQAHQNPRPQVESLSTDRIVPDGVSSDDHGFCCLGSSCAGKSQPDR